MADRSKTRNQRRKNSPHFDGCRFKNIEPVANDMILLLLRAFKKSPEAKPKTTPSTTVPDFAKILAPYQIGVTWFGHSSVLLEMNHITFITDPVWSNRASPSQTLGPKRFFDPIIPLSGLPSLDFVLISHNHYDHLDAGTIRVLANQVPQFITCLGVGKNLESMGVASEKIIELDWWQSTKVGDLEIVCTPARHFSGRGLGDRNKSLWASWCFLNEHKRVFFSGDTGVNQTFKEIGNRYGPFDMTLLEIGAYDPSWPHVHLGPDHAWDMHRDLKGHVLFPVHWGLFDLGFHGWSDPIERLVAIEQANPIEHARVLSRLPGERFELNQELQMAFWWR